MSNIWCVEEHLNPTNTAELMQVDTLSNICNRNEEALQVGHPTNFAVVAYFDTEQKALDFEKQHRADFQELHPRLVKKLGQFG